MSANIDLIKDIWHFILKKNKNFFFIVLFLINLNSLLEVLTLSLIVPFIMNILSSKSIEQNFFLEKRDRDRDRKERNYMCLCVR